MVQFMCYIGAKRRAGSVLMALYRELKLIGKGNFVNRFFWQFALGLFLSHSQSVALSLSSSLVGFEILLVMTLFWKRATSGKPLVHRQQHILHPNSQTYSSSHHNRGKHLSSIWSHKTTDLLHSETKTSPGRNPMKFVTSIRVSSF